MLSIVHTITVLLILIPKYWLHSLNKYVLSTSVLLHSFHVLILIGIKDVIVERWSNCVEHLCSLDFSPSQNEIFPRKREKLLAQREWMFWISSFFCWTASYSSVGICVPNRRDQLSPFTHRFSPTSNNLCTDPSNNLNSQSSSQLIRPLTAKVTGQG